LAPKAPPVGIDTTRGVRPKAAWIRAASSPGAPSQVKSVRPPPKVGWARAASGSKNAGSMAWVVKVSLISVSPPSLSRVFKAPRWSLATGPRRAGSLAAS
jgi:hypothetical protein